MKIHNITVFDMRFGLKLAFTVAFTYGIASSVMAADFSTVYKMATQNDSIFAEARARYEAAQQKLPQGRAGLLPNVSISASTTQNDEQVENRQLNTNNSFDFGSRSLSLSLTQPLFRWQNWVGYDVAKLAVMQAEIIFANARQDLILRTAQAYFDVLVARDNLIAAQEFRSAVESQLTLAREAFRIGTGVVTDVHDAETRFGLAQSQVLAAQTELELRQTALEIITGPVRPNLSTKRQDANFKLPQPNDLSQWMSAAKENNLVVQQQRLAAEIATAEIERQKAGHYPTVDLVASISDTSTLNSGARLITDANRIGLQLNLPIYQGGEVSSRHTEAIANKRAALAVLESARRSASLSAQQAYLGTVTGQQQIKTLENTLEAAKKAQVSNKDAFDIGIRLNIDVINSQNQVFSVRRDLNRATTDTLLSQLRLKAAVGNLNEEDVIAVNGMLGAE